MKITPVKEPFEYLIIDDMYSEDELKLIWNEIEFLSPKLESAFESSAAFDATTNVYKKTASGMFLDAVYAKRQFSDILTLNRKLFSEEVIGAAKKLHPSFGFMDLCNNDSTMLNHYKDGDYYLSHRDVAVFTAVTFFIDGVGFGGGDFEFTDYDCVVEQKNNRTVIFPSCVQHSVSKVKVPVNGKGRYSMAQFIMMR